MNISETIENICLTHNYNGTVLISKNDRIIYNKGFGYSNIELNVLNQPDTIIRIASISKQFTAFVILQLIQKGLLKLTDTIDRFLPDYAEAKKVTIHHLLSNTSGIPNFPVWDNYYDQFQQDNSSFYTYLIDTIIKPYTLSFTPGEKFEYSGSGYIILTYIIEQLSNMPFDQYLKKYIFEPLQMDHSGFDFSDKIVANKATNYDSEDGNIIPAKYIDLRLAGGGGGLYSTVEDLHKWNQSLLKYTLLPKQFVDMMFTKYIQINHETWYGYGLFLAESNDFGQLRKEYYHTGGGPGVQAVNVLFLDDDVEIIMLANINDKHMFHSTREAIYEAVLKKDSI